MKKKKWFDGLEALRGWLIILIIISHSGAFFETSGMLGAASTSAFFVLSGFLSGYFFHRKKDNKILTECLSSLWKRLKEFYPLHLVMLVFSCFVRWSNLSDFLKCITLTQSYWGDIKTAYSFNWVSWFLSSILLSFLLSPIINIVCEKLSKYSEIFIVLITVMIFVWAYIFKNDSEAYSNGYYYTYIFPPARTLEFIAGTFLSNIFKKNENRQLKINYDYLECAVILVFCLLTAYIELVPKIYTWTAIWTPIAYAFVYMFAKKIGKISGILTCKFACFIGSISFEIFLIHRLVMIVAANLSKTIVTYAISVLVSIIFAYLWHLTTHLIKQKVTLTPK